MNDVDVTLEDDLEDMPAGALALEALIDGKPMVPLDGQECEHRVVNTQMQAALIRANEDATGPIIGRQLLVKARCGECGVPFTIDAGTARMSRTAGAFGVVVELGVPAE